MGWVTLALRKQELITAHNELEYQDLDISRRKRQMLRQYNNEASDLRMQERVALNNENAEYQEAREALKNAYHVGSDSQTQDEKTDYQNALAELQQEHQVERSNMQTEWEDDITTVEQEAKDIETDYDCQQSEIEAEMESVAQELEAVKQQISTDIQNSTISLK